MEYLEITKEILVETVNNLKNAEDKQFNMMLSVSGVDKQDCFEVVYHLFSTAFKKNIIIKVKLERENPIVESLCGIYSAANWHERETYDLFGIIFKDHPELERILLPKDWIGYPLRKDYVLKDERLSWNER